MRPLFFEFPDDPTSWLIDDQYFFGEALLVAPLFETGSTGRRVYLPPGTWIDYQTGRVYEGGRWHEIEAGPVPIIVLVRDHTVLPHIALAQSTMEMNWSRLELQVFSTDGAPARGWVALPGEAPMNCRFFRARMDPSCRKIRSRGACSGICNSARLAGEHEKGRPAPPLFRLCP
ncbi:hypothetical protein [Rhodothermus marinus]|uniref:hypothetical protein n=1 Tax=Rhodothermus marinus TaxID=29549 RepID=UPI0034E2354B